MENKLWIIIGAILLALVLLNGVSSVSDVKQKIPLLGCEDYDYQVEFVGGELPVEMDIYIVDNGEEEFFKKDFAYDRTESTLLHCGHDYKIVYTIINHEPFVDYVSIPEYNPLIIKTTKIQIQ